MIQYAPDVNKVVRGLSAVVEQQHPLVKMFIHNWAITGVAAAALGLRLWRQHKRGDLNFWNGVQDAGIVISPVVGLFLLQKIAEEKEVQKSIAQVAYEQGEDRGSAPPPPRPPQALQTTSGRPLQTPQPQILTKIA